MAEETKQKPSECIIIGGGPAGLTAGYLLSQAGWPVTLFESDPDYLGGISRTVQYRGFRFDIGGHRFFSKFEEVEQLWTDILGEEMLQRPRQSRIYYRGKFFHYPLRPLETLFRLGLWESILCVASYVKAKWRPVADPRTFEDWVSNRFGKRLFSIFFETYTSKVWGMSCREISADWAAQRIKGLSMRAAIQHALFERGTGSKKIKSLLETFRYPRLGPGMMWERCGELIRQMGGEIRMGFKVTSLERENGEWVAKAVNAAGEARVAKGSHVISSTDLRGLVKMLQRDGAEAARDAAQALHYRDFVLVALIVRGTKPLADNWIYIHDPGVKVGRVQNFGSWSPDMLADPETACLGLEYFCFEGDGLWASSNEDLIALAKREAHSIGLIGTGQVLDGSVVRQPKAYPSYDVNYADRVKTIRTWLENECPGVHTVGRNGMHKYNNQDHSMMTALLTVRNIMAGRSLYDVWEVNEDSSYHEEGEASGDRSSSGLRAVPPTVR